MNINRTEFNLQDTKRFSEMGIAKASPSLAQNSANIQDQRAKSISEEQQEKMMEQVKKLNESIASSGKELKFKYNEEAEQLYVEVLDAKTKEVVTSLPPEFLIDLSIKMKEMIGMFMDEKI
ncbi:flagellar protein FlaG [Paenibacillus phoenicis]|jgi:flagellar protein FlaG|uniref:Flagellar protein FlaG n=1 Tax=Paenibacillus phoenicis TaxID=554117 RepID=A0ABU5PN71_9BACL|nr:MULTISPECIES: flagellar protein FlaG [Paenibacillus]MEA3571360.1 flagellar protein FlaG [Paenibacillus phoenicis]